MIPMAPRFVNAGSLSNFFKLPMEVKCRHGKRGAYGNAIGFDNLIFFQ
jgi:hypothetical protein